MKKTMKLYTSTKKDSNNELYGEHGSECICCGKPMAKGECLWVHMNEGWQCVHPSITDENCKAETGYESQGCFPIGNECAKKMIGFTFNGILTESHPFFKK